MSDHHPRVQEFIEKINATGFSTHNGSAWLAKFWFKIEQRFDLPPNHPLRKHARKMEDCFNEWVKSHQEGVIHEVI